MTEVIYDEILGKLRTAEVGGGTGGTEYVAGDGINISGNTISATGGGGEGTVTGIEASVDGGTATIAATGSTTSVNLTGTGGLKISENTNGEIELDVSDKQDTIIFNDDEFNVTPSSEDPSPTNTYKPNRLYGKILCCVGDSITAGQNIGASGIIAEPKIPTYLCNSAGVFSRVTADVAMTYGWQIANRNNMTYYGGGVGYSTMADVAEHNGFSAENGRYTKLPDELDYLLIFFGANDAVLDSLGTISDATNTTFYGGWNTVMPYLLNKYPYAKIGLIVPYSSDADFREAVRLVGNKYGVGVFDMFQAGTPLFYEKETSVGVEASIVTSNRSKFLSDNVHPNLAGHTQLADMFETFLYTL